MTQQPTPTKSGGSSAATLEAIFASCDIKGGKGDPGSPIAVLYAAASKDQFFYDAVYLKRLCDHFGIPPSDVYVTPIIKDYQNIKPAQEYIDLLIEELAIINPNVAWILGRQPLELMMIGDPKRYYRHIYGMYIPVLVEGFYGLLLPDSKQASNMPRDIQIELNDRMTRVVKHFFKLKEEGSPGPKGVPRHMRGDIFAIQALAEYEGFQYDPKLRSPKSYFYFWSEVIQDHLVVCMNAEAKEKWTRLGFGVVFTAEEVMDLERQGADFLARSIKQFKARSATKIASGTTDTTTTEGDSLP